jgi:hypothetical protein
MFLLIRSTPAPLTISAPKKLRDKRLRHSRSMPLQDVYKIEEAYTRSRPVYQGKHPLKVSDIQLLVDSQGHPHAPIQHPAFDPVVEQLSYATSADKPSHKDILKQFPAAPANKSFPRRPKVAAPPLDLYNGLPPNPAFQREKLCGSRPDLYREPYRQVVESQPTSSSRHRNVELAFLLDDLHGQEDRSSMIMKHSNISTKSLGANARLKVGPEHCVVVNGPARYDSRPHIQSSTSSRSTMLPNTSQQPSFSRRDQEFRQRQASNLSLAISATLTCTTLLELINRPPMQPPLHDKLSLAISATLTPNTIRITNSASRSTRPSYRSQMIPFSYQKDQIQNSYQSSLFMHYFSISMYSTSLRHSKNFLYCSSL